MLGRLPTVRRLSRNRLGRLSIGRLVEGYLLAKRAEGRAPATISTIEKRLGRLVAFTGDVAIDELHVDELRRWLIAMKQGRCGRPTSDTYVENHRREAATFFRWSVRERHLSRSPMEKIEAYRVTRPAIRTLTQLEIATLLDHEPDTAEGIRNRAALAFMYDTGVRVGELVRVMLDDVDLPNGTVRIVGKNREVQSMPLSPALRSLLWTYIERARPRELFAGTAQLFVSRSGEPLSTNAVRLWMRRAKAKAGIDPAKRVSPHVIRASAATHFAAAGASAFVVQRFLRHKTPTMSQRYVDVGSLELARIHATASPLQSLPRGA